MIDRFLCLDAYLSVYHILYKINLFLLHWDRNVLFSNTYQNFDSFIYIPYSDGFYHRFARPFQLESVRLGILCEVKVFPQTHFAVCSSWSLNFFNIFFIFIEKKKKPFWYVMVTGRRTGAKWVRRKADSNSGRLHQTFL